MSPSIQDFTVAPKLNLIALTGRPGAGKATVAQILRDMGYQAIAFSGLLRDEVGAAWRLAPCMLTDSQAKTWDIPALAIGMCSEPAFLVWAFEQGLSLHEPHSPLWALQNWAIWRRRCDPDYFVRPVKKWIGRKVGTGSTRLVVTDLHFENEWHMLEGLGAHTLHIHRHIQVTDTANLQHESEEALHRLPQHARIANDGTLTDLADAVKCCPIVLRHEVTPFDIARKYSIECETYDRTVCTGRISPGGSVMPATARERDLINKHAVRRKEELLVTYRLAPDEFRQALKQYENSREASQDLQRIPMPPHCLYAEGRMR